MFGRAQPVVRVLMAATMVAIVAGCDGITDPPPGSQVAVIEEIADFTVKGTEVRFSVTVTDAIDPRLEWFLGNDLICTGNPCVAMVPVGSHLVTVRMTDQNGSDVESFTVTVEPADIIIDSTVPADGEVLAYGEPWDCSVVFHYDPGPTLTSEATWELDGRLTSCGELLDPGVYTLAVNISSLDGSHRVMASISFTVGSPIPVMIAREGDFYTVDLSQGPSSLKLASSGSGRTWQSPSPDGSLMAYVARSAVGDCFEIFLSNLNGSDVRSLTPNCAAGSVRAPVWSPDGKTLAFQGSFRPIDREKTALFTVNMDGLNLRRVSPWTCDEGYNNRPCWAGVARGIVFHSAGLIFAQHEFLDGATSREVTLLSGFDGLIKNRIFEGENGDLLGRGPYSISSDNNLVVVASQGTEQVVVARSDGSGVVSRFDASGWTFFCGSADWLYYVPGAKPNSFRKVRVDGTDDQELFVLSGGAVNEAPRCML